MGIMVARKKGDEARAEDRDQIRNDVLLHVYIVLQVM